MTFEICAHRTNWHQCKQTRTVATERAAFDTWFSCVWLIFALSARPDRLCAPIIIYRNFLEYKLRQGMCLFLASNCEVIMAFLSLPFVNKPLSLHDFFWHHGIYDKSIRFFVICETDANVWHLLLISLRSNVILFRGKHHRRLWDLILWW